ncbi:lipoprotein [Bordetella ansorpii]|uniref:Lipoprotein n=1 Tax=Bordetella ansorpii TaxID=288768 RepID=A0A157SMI9_9BORD|nr:RsiV family protein [Bordetella ansorpii]SAI71106.1 lipoprotein [Bordetella ansorpii]
MLDLPRRAGRATLITLAAVLAAACGSSPPDTISLPARGTAASVGDVRTESVKRELTKPGCRGECPRIVIDSVAFPGIAPLTQAVDRGLASMTGVDANLQGNYRTIDEYVAYFWRTAQPRDRTDLHAKVRDTVGDLIGVELTTEQYLTGAAHPIPATHFLNWRRSTASEITLAQMVIPGRGEQYLQALRQAHAAWLKQNEDARRDPAAYNKNWPFQPTDNVTLTRQGMVVKYDAYAIAPYSYGQPELTLPYPALRGILKPEFMPPGS